MTYSAALGRHVEVPVEQLNRFDQAELDDAIAHLPGWPACLPQQVRAAAEAGDLNARLVCERADGGDPTAWVWAGGPTTRRTAGRPPAHDDRPARVVVRARIEPETLQWLTDQCRARGISLSAMVDETLAAGRAAMEGRPE